MKIVLDTNVAVSGLLWQGPPNQLLKWAREKLCVIIGCEQAVGEINRVLNYGKFSKRVARLGFTPDQVAAYYMNLITFVPNPKNIPNTIEQDPFDNIFLAMAAENNALLIVSGDKHLLDLGEYLSIPIVTPAEACGVINKIRTGS